ncbi:hypothetical protein HZC09_05815 [Candidatus Micrarchaeota archaeon]|nr:hypothetical protein [Candidatus Micrarchaeota archaeon]
MAELLLSSNNLGSSPLKTFSAGRSLLRSTAKVERYAQTVGRVWRPERQTLRSNRGCRWFEQNHRFRSKATGQLLCRSLYWLQRKLQMELVVDTNIAIAAIMRNGTTRNLVLSGLLKLCSVERLGAEIAKYREYMIEKTGLEPSEIDKSAKMILSKIELVPESAYESDSKEAKSMTPDIDDWPFLALALHENCGLWSNDKKLRRQKKVKVYSTPDLRVC